ncbi:MAG TPA: hypothetical protein VN222_09120 [Novosphingobium sp.]|nr:hypothetical protein [Novosphingobium sp.]
MEIKPLQEAVVSVFDIGRIAEAMQQACGYALHPLADAPPEQFAAWHVPADCQRIAQALLVPPGAQGHCGALRLVRFHGAGQRVMRSSQRSWDTGGIFDVDMFSADVDAVYQRLQRCGWTAMGDPVDYSEAHFAVRQVVAQGPDGLTLAIIQRYAPPVAGLDPAGQLSPIFNSTQMVADFDLAARFYAEVLGWGAPLAFTIEGVAEPGAEVLGLPMPQAIGARRRLAIFSPSPLAEGGVELIENMDMRGRRFDAHCVAPNVGHLSLRFEVADAPAYASQIEGRGGKLYARLRRLAIDPLGDVCCFAVRSPEGAIIEFFSY